MFSALRLKDNTDPGVYKACEHRRLRHRLAIRDRHNNPVRRRISPLIFTSAEDRDIHES